MVEILFREGQGLANVTGIPLTQGIVPAFDMAGFSGLFANTLMGVVRENFGISVPEVAESLTVLIYFRDGLP